MPTQAEWRITRSDTHRNLRVVNRKQQKMEHVARSTFSCTVSFARYTPIALWILDAGMGGEGSGDCA